MAKYTAINIGPIIGTISLAKRPRELWAASYLFSFFMECIIDEIVKTKAKIISPALLTSIKGIKKTVGLYPDRVFVESECSDGFDAQKVIDAAFVVFTDKTGIGREYINVMYVTRENKSAKGIIKELNYLLDCTELFNRTIANEQWEKVQNLIREKQKSPLFEHATDSVESFYIPMLAELASVQLSSINIKWHDLILEARKASDDDDDSFYSKIKESYKTRFRSFHKYFCVVQADGDNMGKIVSALDLDKIENLSVALLQYGSEVSKLIERYGGLPIYAGGDDLLFIAPVVSEYELDDNNKVISLRCIFDLITEIDKLYKKEVEDVLDTLGRPKDDNNKELHTSISYGLSISYYKYPLYEALKSARELLFDKAKHVEGKNAIAWCLRKHSGSGFVGSLCKNSDVYTSFSELMGTSVDESTVSAIAHKLRENQDLLDIVRRSGRKGRIEAFYNKVMEESPLDDKSYKGITRNLLWKLFDQEKSKPGDKAKSTEEILETLYGMLRTAKFINGEGDSDE